MKKFLEYVAEDIIKNTALTYRVLLLFFQTNVLHYFLMRYLHERHDMQYGRHHILQLVSFSGIIQN